MFFDIELPALFSLLHLFSIFIKLRSFRIDKILESLWANFIFKPKKTSISETCCYLIYFVTKLFFIVTVKIFNTFNTNIVLVTLLIGMLKFDIDFLGMSGGYYAYLLVFLWAFQSAILAFNDFELKFFLIVSSFIW